MSQGGSLAENNIFQWFAVCIQSGLLVVRSVCVVNIDLKCSQICIPDNSKDSGPTSGSRRLIWSQYLASNEIFVIDFKIF